MTVHLCRLHEADAAHPVPDGELVGVVVAEGDVPRPDRGMIPASAVCAQRVDPSRVVAWDPAQAWPQPSMK